MINADTAQCFLCSKVFPYGHGRYPVIRIQDYDMMVCATCLSGNEDGWNPRHEAKILAHLRDIGMPVPPRLPNELLPIRWEADAG